MELCVMTPALQDKSLDEALGYLKSLGITSVELGVGGYPGKNFFDILDYIGKPAKIQELKDKFASYNIKIAAVACHGNPVHPNKEIAQQYHKEFVDGMKFASEMGIDTIIGFSGCPGDCEKSENPNWVTCAWPNEYLDILDWQWNKVLIPYWKETAKIAKEYGIKKIAFEMHPGFCVYNPETLLKLRAAVGDIIGANFDPSHLYWQGINPSDAIKYLGGAIYHFHAKDTLMDEYNTKRTGVLDYKSYTDVANRSWVFRTVGYGHSKKEWKDIISALQLVGYDGPISIEHEDILMAKTEGLEKAVNFLKDVLIYGKADAAWWI